MRAISKNVRYYLSARKKWEGDKEIARAVVISFGYHNKVFSTTTGVKVSQNNWDVKRQRVKTGVKRGHLVNQFLDKLTERINDIYFTALSEQIEITNTYILNQLNKKSLGPAETAKSFWQYYAEFLEMMKNIVKPSTWKSLKYSCKKFTTFCKYEGKMDIKFDEITPNYDAPQN
jgi:hypothetical protein